MKITDHKLSEGIALTFRVPEGNIKHPLIILCHGLCGIRNVLLPCFANAFTEAGFATITLIIEDSVRVMENEGVWFLQCRPKILFQLSIGQKSRNVLIISVLGYGNIAGRGHVFSAAAQDQRVNVLSASWLLLTVMFWLPER